MTCYWDMAIWRFFKMANGRHLGFDPTGNGAVRSAVPENPTVEPNTTSIGWRVAELWPFEVFHTLGSGRRTRTLDNGDRRPDTGYRTPYVIDKICVCRLYVYTHVYTCKWCNVGKRVKRNETQTVEYATSQIVKVTTVAYRPHKSTRFEILETFIGLKVCPGSALFRTQMNSK